MKLIRSGTAANVVNSNESPNKSAPLPNTQLRRLIRLSSADLNHNAEDANWDNDNTLENADAVFEAVNVNIGNL